MGERAGWSWRGKGLFFWIFLAGVVLDLGSKAWAFHLEIPFSMGEPPVRWVLDHWLGLTHTQNPGAIWGIGGSMSGLLVGIRLVVLLFVLAFLLRMPRDRKLAQAALGLISAGAVGNLVDNLSNRAGGFTWNVAELLKSPGMVRDFIHVDLGFWPFHPWPDFNAADSMILIGVLLLVLFHPTHKESSGKSSAASG